MKRILLVVTAISVIGVACGNPVESPGAGGLESPVSNTPGSDDAQGPGGPQRVEPNDGLVDVRATTFDRSARRDGGRALDLFFWSGVEECYGVDRVEVEYFKKVVSVTIFEGRRPEAETCIEMAVRKVVRVEMDEPIRNRTVVDGGASG